MRIYLHLLAAFFLFFAGSIYANTQQEKRVTGTVTSEGEPLPGVSVQLKGASSGTITDIDGNYSIEAPVNGTLVFRFVGMKTVEQPVNNRNVINVTLDSESKELEEVMVVAYATAKKYSFTGAASTMKAGEIEKLQTSSVSRVLEGTVSGVQRSTGSINRADTTNTDFRIRSRLTACRTCLHTGHRTFQYTGYTGSLQLLNFPCFHGRSSSGKAIFLCGSVSDYHNLIQLLTFRFQRNINHTPVVDRLFHRAHSYKTEHQSSGAGSLNRIFSINIGNSSGGSSFQLYRDTGERFPLRDDRTRHAFFLLRFRIQYVSCKKQKKHC